MIAAFNNLSIRNKILFKTAIILSLFAIVSIIVYIGVEGNLEREQEVRLSYQIISAANNILANTVEMQTGERGFLITGDEAFLDAYNNGISDYQARLTELKALVEDQQQVAGLAEIENAVDEWNTSVLVPAIELRRAVNAGTASMDDVVALVASHSGQERMDRIRELVGQFGEREYVLLDERTFESESSATMLRSTLIGGTAFAFIFGLIATVIISSSISRRLGLVAQAVDGVAAGKLNADYELPSGNDEVGALANGFTVMAGTIRNQMAEQQRANAELRAASDTKVAKEYLEAVVRNYSSFANDVAQGNLGARLKVDKSQGELAELGENLNLMVASLHKVTSQVKQASTDIAAAAAEILAATTQQASSATEQSAAITQTTTTVEEVKSIAQQTSQQAAQTAQDIQSALGIARQGTQAVEGTIFGMNQIRDRVESIAQTILSLAEQTQAIGVINVTVSELADQSNLLALNAAIEAARAGEQGKSFAVVAQHVRDLAERSKLATSQVQEILSEIQRATNAAVMVTEEGSKGVEAGTQLASEAGQVIHRIAAEVESGAQANVQMAAAAQQQTVGMDQVGQAMSSIQQATTQALASTRQAEQAARNLHELAQSLQSTVDAYRL